MISVPFLAQLIAVVLKGMPMPHYERAVPLLLGIAAQESGLEHTMQLGGGPALGYWQMEPITEKDHWRWLEARKSLQKSIVERCGVERASPVALQHNLPYQIIMARLHFYHRDPESLPEVNDIAEQAIRWKVFYNTNDGKGTIAQYRINWNRFISSSWKA